MAPSFAAKPEELVERFARAWNKGDAGGIASLFTSDADFVNVVGLWWRSREEIERAHAYGFKRIFGGARLDLERVEVKHLADRVATVHGRWVLRGQAPHASGPADERRGVLMLVAQREPEGWLAAAAQNTDIVPHVDTILARGAERAGAKY